VPDLSRETHASAVECVCSNSHCIGGTSSMPQRWQSPSRNQQGQPQETWARRCSQQQIYQLRHARQHCFYILHLHTCARSSCLCGTEHTHSPACDFSFVIVSSGVRVPSRPDSSSWLPALHTVRRAMSAAAELLTVVYLANPQATHHAVPLGQVGCVGVHRLPCPRLKPCHHHH